MQLNESEKAGIVEAAREIELIVGDVMFDINGYKWREDVLSAIKKVERELLVMKREVERGCGR